MIENEAGARERGKLSVNFGLKLPAHGRQYEVPHPIHEETITETTICADERGNQPSRKYGPAVRENEMQADTQTRAFARTPNGICCCRGCHHETCRGEY